MYSVEQTKTLSKIIFLRDIGFSTEEIFNALKNWDSESLKNEFRHKEIDVDIEVCIVTEEKGIEKDGVSFRKTEAFDLVATTMVYGPYENISGAYKSFVNWLDENNQYEISGLSMQVCHKGPWNEENPTNYLTEIQIPIKIKS